MNYRTVEMFGRTYRRTDSMPADVWVSEDGHALTKTIADPEYRGTLVGKTGHRYYTVSGEVLAKDGTPLGTRDTRTVSSLVWEAFAGVKLKRGRRMRHLNGDTLDNSFANLQPAPKKDRMVAMVDPKTGETVDLFRTVRSAAAAAKVSPAFVRVCLEGRAKTAGGWKWAWDDCDPDPQELVKINQ